MKKLQKYKIELTLVVRKPKAVIKAGRKLFGDAEGWRYDVEEMCDGDELFAAMSNLFASGEVIPDKLLDAVTFYVATTEKAGELPGDWDGAVTAEDAAQFFRSDFPNEKQSHDEPSEGRQIMTKIVRLENSPIIFEPTPGNLYQKRYGNSIGVLDRKNTRKVTIQIRTSDQCVNIHLSGEERKKLIEALT